MTQVEEILSSLHDQPRGLTANDLHVRTGIPKGTLGTYLWELKRDGYIGRVGGVRGNYRYGITERGKERIGVGDDPLKQLAKAVTSQSGANPALKDFDETLKVIGRLDEYRTIKTFASWLTEEHPHLFIEPTTAGPTVQRYVLEHLGIDASTYKSQSRALIELLEFMREST